MGMEDKLYPNEGLRRRTVPKARASWNEMFGPTKRFKLSNFKRAKSIRICLSVVVAVLLPYVVYYLYSMRPPKFEVRRPSLSDLSEHRKMRGDMSSDLRAKVIGLLEESCELNSFTLLFCHNVFVDDKSLSYPCFMRCSDRLFLSDLKKTETDSEDTIRCVERYANKTETFVRPKYVVLNAVRGLNLDSYIRVPNSTSEACIFQHAESILSGTWLVKT